MNKLKIAKKMVDGFEAFQELYNEGNVLINKMDYSTNRSYNMDKIIIKMLRDIEKFGKFILNEIEKNTENVERCLILFKIKSLDSVTDEIFIDTFFNYIYWKFY